MQSWQEGEAGIGPTRDVPQGLSGANVRKLTSVDLIG
jgi:hypothetical protein